MTLKLRYLGLAGCLVRTVIPGPSYLCELVESIYQAYIQVLFFDVCLPENTMKRFVLGFAKT